MKKEEKNQTTTTVPSSEEILKILEETNQKIQGLEAEKEAEKQRRLAIMADFENYKKRIEGEKALFGAMANMGLITDILEVDDDIILALNDENLDLKNASESLHTAKEKIESLVKKAGVMKLPINIGDDFKKETMEAIGQIPATSEEMKGKVVAIISSAYKYTDRDSVIKPAKVILGK